MKLQLLLNRMQETDAKQIYLALAGKISLQPELLFNI